MSKKKPSELEVSFMQAWKLLADKSIAFPVREWRFHPKRLWRFDFAWEKERVAVETEGGVTSYQVTCNHCHQKVFKKYSKTNAKMVPVFTSIGGHMSMKGYQSDCEKYTAAAVLGWRVLRFTAADVRGAPVQMIEQIVEALSGEVPFTEASQQTLFLDDDVPVEQPF